MEALLRRLEVVQRSPSLQTFHDHRVARGQPIGSPAHRVPPKVVLASVLLTSDGGMEIKERLSRGTACERYAGMQTHRPRSLNHVLILLL